MKIKLFFAWTLVICLLFTSCGKSDDTSEYETVTFGTDTTSSKSSDDVSSGDSENNINPDDIETFFDVTEYDYTAETNEDIINYFHGDIGSALTKLAPSVKAVAYAAYCYPEDMAGAPEENMLWCAIYNMIDIFHQYPSSSSTDKDGNTVVSNSSELQSMVSDMFTSEVSAVSAPSADYLDSLIFYDEAKGTYTFAPSGGEGLEIRICALEPTGGPEMNISIQIYNEMFDFSSWVSLNIVEDTASVYGYTVSSATVWTEE